MLVDLSVAGTLSMTIGDSPEVGARSTVLTTVLKKNLPFYPIYREAGLFGFYQTLLKLFKHKG